MAKKRGVNKRKRKIKEENRKTISDFLTRYLILLLAPVNNLWIFYFLLTPLTLYASAFLLNLLYPVYVFGNKILIGDKIIEIVKACVAGSAYYLLLILNFTASNIKFKKRIFIFLFDSILLFILNIARIILLAVIYIKDLAFFDITHKLFWYGISTIYVVLIWLLTIKVFRIKSIPVYSDFVFLLKQARKQEKTKRKKKSR